MSDITSHLVSLGAVINEKERLSQAAESRLVTPSQDLPFTMSTLEEMANLSQKGQFLDTAASPLLESAPNLSEAPQVQNRGEEMGRFLKAPTGKQTQILTFSVRDVFGRLLYYPECEASKLFAQMAKKTSFTKVQIDLFSALGYAVEQVLYANKAGSGVGGKGVEPSLTSEVDLPEAAPSAEEQQ